MTLKTTTITALALTLSCLLLGVSTEASGSEDEPGYTCMPTDLAKDLVRADRLPDWWYQADDDVDMEQAMFDDCMENGFVTFDGDVGYFVENPTADECYEYVQAWLDWNVSAECNTMGKDKAKRCMDDLRNEDEWGAEQEWHSVVCDRMGEACAIACDMGSPGVACS